MSQNKTAPGASIESAIRAASAQGSPALVAYVTAGFPTLAGFAAQLRAVAAGADVIEIGVPFTDPLADGVTIQRSSSVALAQGVSLKWILEELAAMPALPVPRCGTELPKYIFQFPSSRFLSFLQPAFARLSSHPPLRPPISPVSHPPLLASSSLVHAW